MSTVMPIGELTERKLVLESVGSANAAALRAIRQLVPSPLQDVAKLVYQAPSELARGLRPEAASQVAQLLGELGFQVDVVAVDAPIATGEATFEVALVIDDVDRLPEVIAEVASFLGTDPDRARQIVCRSPAVLVSQVSTATVSALRQRFEPLGVVLDVSHLPSARYYAVISCEGGLRQSLTDLIRSVAPDAAIQESNAVLGVSELAMEQAQALWSRLQRLGARASICNHEFERYDISLRRAVDSQLMGRALEELGVPGRLVSRVLAKLPVVVQRNVPRSRMQTALDVLAAAGGEAAALPYSFQRFALAIHAVRDARTAVETLMGLGDVARTAAEAASQARGEPFGRFTNTTARWLQRILESQGARVSLELL